METNNILYNELISKRKHLEQVALALKEKFLGLDNIIDEIFALLLPWYLFPEAQRRPTVINLWGLTGSGKTALIQQMIQLLDYAKLYTHIDMGEFESNSASWIKDIFTDDLDFFHQKPAIVCLDEFQFARTLDANQNELGKDKLRAIWDLLDSGKLDYIPSYSSHYVVRAENCLRRLERAIRVGIVVEQGEVVAGVDEFIKIFTGYYFEDSSRYNQPIDQTYFLSNDFAEGIMGLFEHSDFSRDEIKTKIQSSSIGDIKAFILEGLRTRPAIRQLDLSHAIIFVLGNLDEAYSMSDNMNPDINADEFHEATSKITIANIKRALRKRFRPEQIARLGNNHVIYRSFSSQQFRELIERELLVLANFVHEKFRWNISFDTSVLDVIYAEGVFPTQGTRPVFTTIKNLIESRISKLVVMILEEGTRVVSIHWKYETEKFIYEIRDAENKIVKIWSDEVSLKLESLRKSVDPEIQAYTAVHEAGHAVLAALSLRIIPSLVVSRTASDTAEGFCLINFPKGPLTRETLKKDIVITLGGYVAEKLIFGIEHTSSGVYSDIEEASALANKAVRKYAMGKDPIHLAMESMRNDDAFILTDAYKDEAIALIQSCESEAELVLKRNKLLLLKIAEYLTIHSRMDEALIEAYTKQYSVETWIATQGFVKKEDYYSFNQIVQQQLEALEEDQAGGEINNIPNFSGFQLCSLSS